MSLLSDLNDKIKALSTRVGAEAKSLWEGVNTAQSTATAAQTTANTANSTANTAKSTADTANSTANSALSTANAKVSKSGDTMTGNLSFGTDKTLGCVWGINGGNATLRASGNVGTQAISLVWQDSEGNTTFNTILDASGNFLPTKTDTKVTNTASTTTKFYITGTSSSSTNTGTQYFDTGVYVTATAGYLHCTRLEVGSGTIWIA